MADLKISQLASANVVNKDDLLYLIKNDTDFNVKAGTLFASIIDPTLSGNIIVSGPIQTLNAAGAVNITSTRTDLYGGKSADTLAIANGSVLPTTIFLYTEGVSASGRGIRFVEDTPVNKTFYVRHVQGKIYLSTAQSVVYSYPPEDWVGPTGLRPFPTQLAFVKGATYTFDVSDPSLASNVINLSTSIDGTNTHGEAYLPGVVKNGTTGTPGANIVFTVPNVAVDTGGLEFLDLEKGVDGQLKIINLVKTEGGRFVLSSNLQNNLAIELRKSGDSAFLMYSSNGWILIGSNPGLVTTFSGTSDDVPEGQRLYFTNARARAAITNGDSTILYNPVTGEIRANILAIGNVSLSNIIPDTNSIPEGLNLYYTNSRVRSNVIALLPTLAGSGILIAANGQISANSNAISRIAGNLTVTGKITANSWGGLYTANIIESNNNLFYANNRVAANVIALLPTLAGTGISITAEGLISATGSANINVGSLTGLNTANVVESPNNLYYTNSRVRSNVIALLPTLAGSGITIAANGQISANVGGSISITSLVGLNTANVAESSSNLYFTNARVVSAITNQDISLNNLIVGGNLTVQGDVVTLNTATLTVEDKNILIANGATSAAVADGAGISIAGANANLVYKQATNSFDLNKDLTITGNILPTVGNQFDIGSNEKPFRDLWLYGSSIKFSNSGSISQTSNTIVVTDASNTIIFTANATNKPITSPTGTLTAELIANVPNLSTSNIAEGTNLYFSNARANAAVQPTVAELRALVSRFNSNVLYVAQNGNDANDGTTFGNAFANIHVALAAAKPWTTVFLKSGDYRLYNQPVTIPRRVALVGDNLRTTTIRPTQPSVDMFYVNNACYVTGITFRDHVSPAAVFSFNPDGSAGTIVTSPYIQNCSSITTTGTGMRVDGRFVSGLRSMVCDAYTQTNEGGIGIHMLNQGYTQLVSVFTICCHIAIKCETGGFCSITNSNASFGTYALWADGVSDPLYYGTVDTGNSEATNELTLKNLSIRPNYGDSVLFANFNQDKCSRDTGLIVDSLAFDLAYSGNSQSNFAGLQYWSQVESAIPNQSVETLDAINYAMGLAISAARGNTLSQIYQSNVAPTNGTAGTTNESNIIANLSVLLTSIITNGTVGVTDIIVPNQYPANTNVNVVNAANNIINNRAFIAAETVAYVDITYPGFFANASNFIDAANAKTTCTRDVGYILDSVVFDLKHSGNKQTIQAGTYYYQYNANLTQINNQVVQTGAAYNYIGHIISNIITATAIAKGYNSAKCERDTGLIVDSIALDLLYSGNSQSNFAGLQYWSQTSSAIPNQSPETIAAINYAKRLATNIVANIAITTSYQASPMVYTQVFASSPTLIADTASNATIAAEFDLISNIISNGTVGVTDLIIPNGLYANTNAYVNHASNLLYLNNAFIKTEVIGYLNTTYPGFFANALNFIDAANAEAKCSRDIGYILDTIRFDLLHGGNKQAIQSGTYYYQYNANVTQIHDQIVKTGQAYYFIAGLIDKILSNTTITPLYQTTVAQNTSAAPAATIAERNKIAQSANLIISIISSGPSAALAKTPIDLTASSDANVRNAANAIIANRDFIKAETIAYIDTELFDPPYQIAVKQNTTAAPAATYAEANVILDRISLITNIIANGPTAAVAKRPIDLTANTNPNVINATKLILANRDYIKAEVLEYVNRSWANISNGSGTFYTVKSATNLISNTSVVTFLETITDTIRANARASFHAGSYISSSGHTFEYVGSGNQIATALPYLGGVPKQENEVIELRGGKVYFTSTDQLGDFRIGKGLVINRVDGTITGRTFNKAMFAVMTPYMLAIEG